MPPRIVITDDGDEHCIITVDGARLANQPINHEDLGWDGMTAVLKLIEEITEALGVRVDNQQNIV